MINIILFFTALSLEYFYYHSTDYALIMVFSSLVLIIAITITSGIIGYYCELAMRTEHKLLNKAYSTIEKTHSILSIMLPPFVRNRVKEGVRYIADNQGHVTIVFCDICDFDKICKDYEPYELTKFLDKVFSNFDQLCENTGTTKIETVGKTYMACAGLKDSDKDIPSILRNESHAKRAVELAFAMIEEAKNIELKNGNFLNLKIGVNSGAVTAGVVGYHKPQFSLVGDTVNTASRMCSTLTQYNSIQISASTYELLKDFIDYEYLPKQVYAKGKGNIPVFIITEPKGFADNLDMKSAKSSFSAKPFTIMQSKLNQNMDVVTTNKNRIKTWKTKILMKEDNNLVAYDPSLKLFSAENNKEKIFWASKIEKNYKTVIVSLAITLTTYTLLFILTILQFIYLKMYPNPSEIIGRGIVIIFLILITVYYHYFPKNTKTYSLGIVLCLSIMHAINMINLYYSQGPPDFIGIEVMYIILLLCQITLLKISTIMILTTIILIP